jgi:rubrerythrin
MNRKDVGVSVLLAAAGLLTVAGCATKQTGPCGNTCPGACACVAPAGASTKVDQQTGDALRTALEDELRAKAFYGDVIAKFGNVRPFANIINAENRHAQVLVTLMERHGVAVSDGAPSGVPSVPATLAECNRVAAQAERDNIAMYDRLLKDVTDPDIRTAFENLRAASLERHLPAFERGTAMSTGVSVGSQGQLTGYGRRGGMSGRCGIANPRGFAGGGAGCVLW